MNKLIKKLSCLAFGLVLSLGVGVSLTSNNIHKEIVGVEAAQTTYEKVSSLVAGDTVLIASYYNSSAYYMLTGGTSSQQPTATKITISDSKITGDYDNYLFTIEADGTNWKFKRGTEYLYTSGTGNNNLRVGSGTNIASSYTVTYVTSGYKMENVTKSGRYVGIYNAEDWRTYTSATASNYKGSGQLINFYKPSSGLRLNSISVKSATSSYYEDSTFDPTNLVITENFSDGTTKEINYSETTKDNFSFIPNLSTKLTIDTTKINITYTDSEYGAKSVDLPLTINEDNVVSIFIDNSSFEGKTFGLNDKWHTNGIIVKATRTSGAVTTLDNSDENLTFTFNPETPNSVELSSVDVTVTYTGLTPLSKTLTGFAIVEQVECTYDFVTNFATYTKTGWMSDTSSPTYADHIFSESTLGATIKANIYLFASKQTQTVTDRPVFKNNSSTKETILEFNLLEPGYKLLNVSIEFKQWTTSKKPTLSLYEGEYSSSNTPISVLNMTSAMATGTLSGTLDNNGFAVTNNGENVALTSISITIIKDADAISEAESWGSEFMEYTDMACENVSINNKDNLDSIWPDLEEYYSAISDNAKRIVVAEEGDNNGSTYLAKAVARYDHIMNRYPTLTNFIQRATSSSGRTIAIFNSNNNIAIMSVVIISFVGITVIGGYLFLKKQKQN